MNLLKEFWDFLGSVKTSEVLTPKLRGRISVDTGLEAALLSALKGGRNVVIAGSAGSGKTHLLDRLREAKPPELPQLVCWPGERAPAEEPFVRVVMDGTALSKRRRGRIFHDLPANCTTVAVAINEGPLLALARKDRGSVYAGAVRLLRAAQNGTALEADASLPTVIDVGGFDPIEAGAVGKMLGLPIFVELIESYDCGCEDPRICPRRVAWAVLQDERVRERVNDLLRVVNMQGQTVLFRELWDFVADLALGGRCDAYPPTSPWFWRIFYGPSSLSHRLRAAADPSFAVFPRAEAHAWHQDWQSLEAHILDGIEFMPLPNNGSMDRASYQWLKTQLFFLVSYNSIREVVRDQVDLELLVALEGGRTEDVVGAINQYMSYGTIPPTVQVLNLWTDMGVEKRTDRPSGQVSLGAVQTTDFQIRRSLIVANHRDPQLCLYGSRYFLVHPDSKASFSLTPEVLNLLRGGRSYRTSDRPHTDMEWYVSRFFSTVASYGDHSRELDVLELDFDSMVGSIRGYRLSQQLGHIEPMNRF